MKFLFYMLFIFIKTINIRLSSNLQIPHHPFDNWFWIQNQIGTKIPGFCLQCLVRGCLRNLNGSVHLLNLRIGFSLNFWKKLFNLNLNLEFPQSKFVGRVISNKTDLPWPPNSPDLNPLDFFFWGHSMNHVYRTKPSTIENLKSIVNDFAESMDPDLVERACELCKVKVWEIAPGARWLLWAPLVI